MKTPHKVLGFTLVELMIVVGIAAILSTLAFSNYSKYVRRANRSEAKNALLSLRTAQEKFFLQNNTYAGAGLITAAAPAGLGFGSTVTDGGNYTVTINLASSTAYVAVATPVSGMPQVNDIDCGRFTINESGARTAQNSGGGDNTATCWR